MTLVIDVRVRYLARLRELAATECEVVGVPADSKLEQLYAELLRMHPQLPPRESVRAVVDLEFVEWSAEVPHGGEVAFIPPVSGGM